VFESFTELACSEVIWNSAILNGVKRHIESIGCAIGARTQEECDISLNDSEEGI
jgi:hypothetical protein